MITEGQVTEFIKASIQGYVDGLGQSVEEATETAKGHFAMLCDEAAAQINENKEEKDA